VTNNKQFFIHYSLVTTKIRLCTRKTTKKHTTIIQ